MPAKKPAVEDEDDDDGDLMALMAATDDAPAPAPAQPLFAPAQKKIEKRIKKEKHTFLNDKGYMVTEMRDVEYEVEVEVLPSQLPVPKPKSQPGAKPATGKAKTKNGSIMSFFGSKK